MNVWVWRVSKAASRSGFLDTELTDSAWVLNWCLGSQSSLSSIYSSICLKHACTVLAGKDKEMHIPYPLPLRMFQNVYLAWEGRSERSLWEPPKTKTKQKQKLPKMSITIMRTPSTAQGRGGQGIQCFFMRFLTVALISLKKFKSLPKYQKKLLVLHELPPNNS